MNRKRKNACVASNDISPKSKYKRKELLSRGLKERAGFINGNWVSNELLDTDDVRVGISPFKHCVVRNIIQDQTYLKELKKELVQLSFLRKHNDLYQLHQSVDLLNIDKPNINCLKRFLKEECRSWVESATGIVLNNKVSSTCSSYTFSDHLLCHDDKCEDRRIAFILYLNETWLSEFGGALELFSTDDHGQPDKVVCTIEPVFNSFVFFEVTCKSFHQVSEVKCMDRTRLSVNGWFHGSLPDHKSATEATPMDRYLFPPLHITNDMILLHVNTMYLNPEVQEQISASFEENSEILLPDFLQRNFYSNLCNCLKSDDLSWKIKGPANRRKHEILLEERLPKPLEQALELLKSDHFLKLLGKLTKLDLIPDDSGTPLCSYQVERWKSGFYTLLHDTKNRNEFALDVILYCNVEQTKQLQGGFTTYVADNVDEELLTVVPSHNALALTFRDKETNRFVKYISNLFDSCFHVFSLTYYERGAKV